HQTYDLNVAAAQNNLGSLYFDKKEYTKAEKAFVEALIIYKQLAKFNFELYEPDIATTQNNLGYVYYHMGDYSKSVETTLEALDVYKCLAKLDDYTYELNVAITQQKLGMLYLKVKNYTYAENCFFESFNICEKWVSKSALSYNDELIKTSKNLLICYISKLSDTLVLEKSKKDRFELVEKILYEESKKDKEVREMLSSYYDIISWYLLFDLKFKEAEQAAKNGLLIEPTNIWIKTNLAHSFLFQGKYEDALKVYLEIKPLKDAEGKSYAAICLEDLNELEKKGIVNSNTYIIREILEK
ncbi:MAG: tetratricopeptide repeat protein, partial [Thermoproteota archaeon]|nr:tetratricopeptide repeat protein [Thermoproteota archaeon]